MSESVGINPGAPRPPLGFRIWFPRHWHLVDLDPRTANRSIDRFLDWCAQQVPAAAQHRQETRRALRQVVRMNQARGIFTLAFLPGYLPPMNGRPAEVVGASLTLVWQQLPASDIPPPATLAEALTRGLAAGRYEEGETPEARSVTTAQLGLGPAAHLRTTQLVPVPWLPSKRPVTISQFMIPMPGQPWLAVLTGTSPNLDLAAGIDAITEAVAQSLELRSALEIEILLREMESASS